MGSNATGRGTTLAAALSKMQSPDKGTYAMGFFCVCQRMIWIVFDFGLMMIDLQTTKPTGVCFVDNGG